MISERATVYTLADNRFLPAVVGLINSLRSNGFTGLIKVGSPEILNIEKPCLTNVEFIQIGDSDLWIGNRKPGFILEHPNEQFIYFDADIVLNDETFFERLEDWLNIGPVFSVEGLVPPMDHRRHVWRKRLQVLNAVRDDEICYYNSGFFAGVMSRDGDIINRWDRTMEKVLQRPGNIYCDKDFPMADQDTLNAILQDWPTRPVGICSPDLWTAAQSVSPFLHVGTFRTPAILHCTGQAKPWMLRQVPPRGPSIYDKLWYLHAVINPTPFNYQHRMSKIMHSWFKGTVPGRLVQFYRRICTKLI